MFEGSYPPGVTGKMIDEYFEGDGRCCENCFHYNGEYCMKEWNNADDDYRLEERDAREPDEFCDDYEWEG